MTYQAASGAGAQAVQELIQQMGFVDRQVADLMHAHSDIAHIDRVLTDSLRSTTCPTNFWSVPLACNAIPWIDRAMPNGQTREEWKAHQEATKLLGRSMLIDGQCVRIGALRCHSQAVTIKLKQAVRLKEAENLVQNAHPWIRFVPNTEEATRMQLTPISVARTLDIAVGRLRPMLLGPEYYTLFTVGDQLLWGAAEPLRRMLQILKQHV
jgi:aspartate-semialdehyde dehydrogenase